MGSQEGGKTGSGECWWRDGSTPVLRFPSSLLPVITLSLSLSACSRHAAPAEREPLKVAAAADLSFAFKDVGAAYEARTGEKVVFSAFHPKTMADLADPRVAKIAIANPDHAPYGKAAKEAMLRAGVWDKVKAKVVYGENVQQTLQFAQSGNADVAIVALSLATVTPGEAAPVPTELHDPIDQVLVACTHGKAGTEEARKFIAFVQSAEGHAVMRKYGFLLPGESMPEAKTDTTKQP